MLVHCRDADAQLLRRILIRHSFPIAQSDDGRSLVGQVMVNAIHRSLPSLFQTRRFFLRQFLFRERKKPFQSFISFLSGYKIDAGIFHAPHQVSPVWNQLFIPQSGEHIAHHIPRLLIIMEQGKGEAIHLLVMVVEQPFHPLFIFFCHHVIFFLFLLLYTSFPEINYP